MATKIIPSSENRIAKIFTPLGAKIFNVIDVSGREAISDLYHFSVSLASADLNVQAAALIGKPVCIKLDTAGTSLSSRYFHGIVKSFKMGGALLDQQRHYQLSFVPWIWFGALSSHHRIFQQKTVIEIVSEVLAQLPQAGAVDTSGIKGVYPKREICIQFDETDLQFVERLMTEEGIAWFFQHTKNAHTLVLSDSNQGYKECAATNVKFSAAAENRMAGIVSGWERQISAHASQIDISDYNEFTPSQQNIHSAKTNSSIAAIDLLQSAFGCHAFSAGDDAIHKLDAQHANQLAKRWQDATDSIEQIISGMSSIPGFFAGGKFNFTHTDASENGAYALLEVNHIFRDGNEQDSHYVNTFQCIPADKSAPVKKQWHKRRVHTALSAKVVELKSGDDAYSQVKVKFPWESNQNSCWVRVAQAYAGNGWGSYFVPQVGQEVIISFLNGDINRPIIVGALYNMENHSPGFSRSQSGIRTQSQDYNELVFDDKKGAEQVHFQAGRDYTFLIKHDEKGEVKNNQQLVVEKNRSITVKSGDDSKLIQSGAANLKAQKTITLESSTQIQLKVGSSTLTIGPQSISLKSAQVSVEGSAQVTVKGGGQVQIKGGIVQIN